MTLRASSSKLTNAWVVISPSSMTNPVLVATSQATRLIGSCSKHESRTASAIWSQILSGWPSVTDSEVNKSLGEVMNVLVIGYLSIKENALSGERAIMQAHGCPLIFQILLPEL